MKGRVVVALLALSIATVLGFIVYRKNVPLQLNYPSKYENGASVEKDESLTCESPRNIIFIYTGRWQFLRIQLAHIYRELHRNGGVIHEVWFMMIN